MANDTGFEPAVTQQLETLGDTLPIVMTKSQDRDLLNTIGFNQLLIGLGLSCIGLSRKNNRKNQ